MKERLGYTIAKLKRQIKNGEIKKETCEILVAQIEAYIELTDEFCDDMEYAEFTQAMNLKTTMDKFDEILKDFGMRWRR